MYHQNTLKIFSPQYVDMLAVINVTVSPSRAHFVLKIDFDNFHLSSLPENFKMCSVLVLYSVYGRKMGVSLAQKMFLVAKASYTCPKSHSLATHISYTS